MKYCPFCGAGLQDTMVFCPKCGKKFLDAVENAETIGQLDMESNLPEYPEEPTQEPVSTQVVDDLSEVESVLPTEPERRSVKRNIKIYCFAKMTVFYCTNTAIMSLISLTSRPEKKFFSQIKMLNCQKDLRKDLSSKAITIFPN